MINTSGITTFTAAEAITPHLRVKLDASQNVVLAGADDLGIGTAIEKAAVGEAVFVRLWNSPGTRQLVCADGVTIGANLYGAAGGKVTDTHTADRAILGEAIEAGSGNGAQIQVILKPGFGGGGHTGDLTTGAITDLTDVDSKTGTGAVVVMQGSPTITTPTIADLTNMNHDHSGAAGGGRFNKPNLNYFERNGTDITAAGTINLQATDGDMFDVTGNTTITAVTLAAGYTARVRFTGTPLLTHGTSLILPTSANITAAAGDIATFRGYSAGVVRCVHYQRLSGASLGAPLAHAHVIADVTAAASDKVFGRSTSGAGAGEEITCTASGRALLDDASVAAQRTTLMAGGTANQVLGVNASATAAEFKTLTQGTGISIVHTAGVATITNTGTPASYTQPYAEFYADGTNNNCDSIREWDDTNKMLLHKVTALASGSPLQSLQTIHPILLPTGFTGFAASTAIQVSYLTSGTSAFVQVMGVVDSGGTLRGAGLPAAAQSAALATLTVTAAMLAAGTWTADTVVYVMTKGYGNTGTPFSTETAKIGKVKANFA